MIFNLTKEISFPPVDLSEPDGLLAIGGDLSPERLILAYRSGIFPWYEGETILWWSPDPRFVLFPAEFKMGKTVSKLIRENAFRFTINRAFRDVIRLCKSIQRPGQGGTWITDEMEDAYVKMHELGYAHSAETWKGEELVGGLYGIRLGKVFFGESMFSLVPNASRYAFSMYVQYLAAEGVELIDCQVHTAYLASFGARMIPRQEYLGRIGNNE